MPRSTANAASMQNTNNVRATSGRVIPLCCFLRLVDKLNFRIHKPRLALVKIAELRLRLHVERPTLATKEGEERHVLQRVAITHDRACGRHVHAIHVDRVRIGGIYGLDGYVERL